MSGPLAVFLDRDGVVNELVPSSATGVAESPLSPEVVRLVGGVGESFAILRAAGYLLVCVTNQPAAAKGVVPIDQLLSVQAKVVELLDEVGARFDAVRMCLHHPEGVISDLTRPCGCRKPQPGMLFSAASELGIELSGSWMIGDTDSDIAAGHAAGCRTVLVETPGSLHKRAGAASIERAADLAGAVSIVVRTTKND